MKEPLVAAFVVLGLVGSYAAAALCAAAGLNPLIGAAGTVVVVGAFGWTRRDRDILDVALPSFCVAYAAYVGLALARVPHTAIQPRHFWQAIPFTYLGALSAKWPLVLVGGIPFALILMVAVAVPISMIPVRRPVDPHANDRLWDFVAERNAHADDVRQAAPPERDNPRA
jgi:hypothetical protein